MFINAIFYFLCISAFLISFGLSFTYGSVFYVMRIIYLLYIPLFLVTSIVMFRSLRPSHLSKPLSRYWLKVGGVLLVLGYTPGLLFMFDAFNRHDWNGELLICVPFLTAPIIVFSTFLAKKKHIPKPNRQQLHILQDSQDESSEDGYYTEYH